MKSIFAITILAIGFSGCATPPSKPVSHLKASLQVEFDVDDRGSPQNVTIASWEGPESERKKIQESAIRAVQGWSLNPNLRGRHLIQPMEFDLEDDAPNPEAIQSSTAQRP